MFETIYTTILFTFTPIISILLYQLLHELHPAVTNKGIAESRTFHNSNDHHLFTPISDNVAKNNAY